MKNVAISVIMPVYNSDRYVRSAIESVLTQDFDSYELILVDDGSTDASGTICDEYAAKDGRVKVIHQKNAGTSAARNAGLAKAIGKYIAFCDHDDEYLPHFLRDVYQLALHYDADLIASSSANVVVHGAYKKTSYCRMPQCVINAGQICQNYCFLRDQSYKEGNLFNYVWNKLYKKESISSLTFYSGFKNGLEDSLFNIQFLFNVKNCVVCVPQIYYKHFYRETSSSILYDKNIDEEKRLAYSFYFEQEYQCLKKMQKNEPDSLKNAEAILVKMIFLIHDRVALKNIKLFKKEKIFNDVFYPISLKTRIILAALLKSPCLFVFLMNNDFISLKHCDFQERTISKQHFDYYDSALNGFFLNMFESKRGRWLFDVSNFFVKMMTLPFRLFKKG